MTEILILLAIALLFFGPSRLPGLGKSMGEAIRGFKKGLETDVEDSAAPREQIKEGSSESVAEEAHSKSKTKDPQS